MLMSDLTIQEAVAEQNDLFRTQMQSVCVWRGHLLIGKVVCTSGVANLPSDVLDEALVKVREFTTFTADNDPHREHDFGTIEVGAGDSLQAINWKFDYFASEAYEAGSDNPQNPRATRRILTIMLASEY